METPLLDPVEAKAAALKTLESVPYISFGTFGLDAWPNLRMLVVATKDDIDTLWFATSTTEKKVAELKANPNAVVYAYHPESMKEFRLFGTVELLSDPSSRRKVWDDDFLQYFPEGVDSPSMIVLKFTTDHGHYASYGEGVGTF